MQVWSPLGVCGRDRAIVGINSCRSESLNLSASVRDVFICIERCCPWRTENQRLLGEKGLLGYLRPKKLARASAEARIGMSMGTRTNVHGVGKSIRRE